MTEGQRAGAEEESVAATRLCPSLTLRFQFAPSFSAETSHRLFRAVKEESRLWLLETNPRPCPQARHCALCLRFPSRVTLLHHLTAALIHWEWVNWAGAIYRYEMIII